MLQRTSQYRRTKKVAGERRKEDIRVNRDFNKQFRRDVIKDRLGSVKNFYYSRTHKANASFEQKIFGSARATKRLADYFSTNRRKNERSYKKDIQRLERSHRCKSSGSESSRNSKSIKFRQDNSVESHRRNSFPVTQLYKKLNDTLSVQGCRCKSLEPEKDLSISNSGEIPNGILKHLAPWFEQSGLRCQSTTSTTSVLLPDNGSSHVTNH
ncbi:MAG: hypothetical protein GY861_02625, partial [bacterium]|nr:hypothetical protein [bacterium]